jgi:hypothetical protein
VDEVAGEVDRLKRGYEKVGEWNLPQTCKHLELAIRYSMQPAPERKNTQTWTQWILTRGILLVRRIPAGQAAAKRIEPPEDVPESAISGFLESLQELKNFRGEFSPHPRLGKMKRRDYVKLQLIHCAHHFGFLIPKTES